MQIPILSGMYTDTAPNFRAAYPVNLRVVPMQNGISDSYLSQEDGITALGTGFGIDRGGIEWNGVCYRAMGTKLVSVSSNGVVTELGDIGGPINSYVTFDYSFDRLAIASGGRLYYWNGTLTQVTDVDLGVVLDFCWIGGYFLTTDGENLVVTELSDPTQVNPLKYGSSEVDPDKIVSVKRLRNEAYSINRHTIEVLDNIGGEFFPFQRIEGAQIQKGAIGTFACCIYNDSIAFLGSGRNEAPAVYLGINAQCQQISTQEINTLLLDYTEQQLSKVKLETRNDKSHSFLYVHLPDKTLVYDLAASKALQQHVWTVLTSSLSGFSEYRARNFVFAYDKWIVGDTQSSNIGYFSNETAKHWGNDVRWEFSTSVIYNNSRNAIINELELVSLTGSTDLNVDARISTSFSVDGKSWSQEKSIKAGTTGQTKKRLVWFRQGLMRNWRIQRFKGDTQSRLSFVRLEVQAEGLAY